MKSADRWLTFVIPATAGIQNRRLIEKWSLDPRFRGGDDKILSHLVAALVLGVTLSLAGTAQAGGTLIVGMTAGDLPITTGNPDQGFEGYRFVGYNLYDSLVLWDLSKSDEAAGIKPGLATEWQVDEANPKRWIFKLRQGVKWHDGCDFTADDVVWNLSHSTNEKAPEFDPSQFAQTRTYLNNFAGIEKIDDHTVAFTTKVPRLSLSLRDQLRADDQPVPRQGGQQQLDRVCSAPVRHRAL